MLAENDVQTVLAAAVARGGEWSEIYAESRSSADVELNNRRVDKVTDATSVGVGIRVVRGAFQSYAYTNRLSRESLLETARTAAAAMNGRVATAVTYSSGGTRSHRKPMRAGQDDLGVQASRVDVARIAEAAAWEQGCHIRQVRISYGEVSQRVFIANSAGAVADMERTRTRLVARVLAESDGLVQTALEAPGFGGGVNALAGYDPATVGREAASRATRLLDSVSPPAGNMIVVLSAGGGGAFLHEACGHGLEADSFVKRTSVYSGSRGMAVAPTQVTLVDDPGLEGGWASYAVDDESTPSARTVLIERGTQVGQLSDRISAALLRLPASSGNGRRQSYAHAPQPRMSNLLMAPGDADPAEIIKDVKRGLFAAGLSGGEVNPTTGDFVFAVTEAYLIEDGFLTKRVRGASLAGNGPSALASIDAVGNDFAVKQGVCGKDGQWVPVAFGTPTLRIAGMTVGGRV